MTVYETTGIYVGQHAEILENARKEIFGERRDPHPLQTEGVRLGSGVKTSWVKPAWPSNFFEGQR